LPNQRNWDVLPTLPPKSTINMTLLYIIHSHHYRIQIFNIYLWRKVVCFVLYSWDPQNQDASDRVLGLFGKLSRRRGAWAWFHGIWTCGVKVFEHLMISSLKIKLNWSWKYRRNWNVFLVLLERSWWARFNGICLVRFGFRMWEILIFKWFLLLKIQINSQKPGFRKEKSVEDVVALRPTAQVTLV
jgi:hypothetical protein